MARSLTSRIAEVVPAICWLRVYQPRWLRADLVAGVTLAGLLLGAIGGLGAHGVSVLGDVPQGLHWSDINLCAGLGQGFPTSGGMSQSLDNESSGAKTPLSGFIASLVILVIALYLSGLLRFLPQPVLAAIVLATVTGLLKNPPHNPQSKPAPNP